METVLGDYLEAVCVKNIEQATSSLKDIKTGRMTVISQGISNTASPSTESLNSKVKAPVDLSEKLGSVLIANNVQSALKKSASLNPGQSVITRDGIWVGSGWLRVSRIAANKGNVLQRKKRNKYT